MIQRLKIQNFVELKDEIYPTSFYIAKNIDTDRVWYLGKSFIGEVKIGDVVLIESTPDGKIRLADKIIVKAL